MLARRSIDEEPDPNTNLAAEKRLLEIIHQSGNPLQTIEKAISLLDDYQHQALSKQAPE